MVEIKCPKCEQRIKFETNSAINWRKEITGIIFDKMKSTPNYKQMNDKYLTSRVQQMIKNEIHHQIKVITKELEK